ncbi:interferon-inducible GTPase 5-like [Leptodactylus fuscus]|uniref:interferon-inducible GTPase 5-like n=1 Tax=Leptodactylus fuscus TaxID=238119 RepID=UPI003F4E4C1B
MTSTKRPTESNEEMKEDFALNLEEEGEVKSSNLNKAAEAIKKSLKEMENIPLNIAITGESGTGKSSFVNAIRSMGDEEEGSAATGVVETTEEPMRYPHPKYPNVTIWDLPGIGTPNFKADRYLQSVKFSQYDFFIIMSSGRFKQNDIELAKAIQAMGKKFYFVRSKVDSDLHASKKRRKKTYNEENILNEIRQNCIQSLEKEGISDPKVFLLSCMELEKYDFNKMLDTLKKELPKHKRHAFLLSLPNLSRPILEKKREALKKDIWKRALTSCGVAAVPIPGLCIACDVGILIDAMIDYQKAFGLDEQSLQQLANKTGIDVSELKSVIKSPLVLREINKEFVISLLGRGAAGALRVAELALNWIPILGSIAAEALSYSTTSQMLNEFLEDIAEDAVQVLNRVLQSSV